MTGIKDIQYVRFSVPDLARQEQFLLDFGFQIERDSDTLYARGSETTPFVYSAVEGEAKFLGLGFEAESAADLQRIAAMDGVQVTDNRAPGGGLIATLSDPDGLPVDIVCNQQELDELPLPKRQPMNIGNQVARTGERVAFSSAPVSVKRLGHCVLNVTDFRTSEAWYKERFGLLTSDEVYIGEQTKVLGAFMRCNRGEHYVDHHTLFLVGTGAPEFNHAAFEVADWDTLMIGHDQLAMGDYEHRWGIGKHLLGSQVFDYWKDPHGFTLEHFTDGDLFNESFGSHQAPIEDLLGKHWGPEGSP